MNRKYIIILLFFFTISLYSQSYTVDSLITNLNQPIAFSFLPNGNVIITHKEGLLNIYSLSNSLISQVWDFSDSCVSEGEKGLLGVTIDPEFQINRFVYIYYIHAIPPVSTSPQWLRVIRLTLTNNNTGSNAFIVFNHPAGVIGCCHVGGNIHFSPDGKLYLTLGETNNQSASQSKTTPLGKILRMNSNGSVPTDNPFYDDGNPYTGYDDRIWSMGHRNSFDFCFSPVNDSLYSTENGLNTADEVNFIRKGKNYGWPICEGYCNPYIDSLKQPMHVWGSPLPAVTGVLVYQGNIYPELNGRLIVAENNDGRIFKCELGNVPFLDTVISRTEIIQLAPLTSLIQGTDGYIYILNGGYEPSGKLYRLKPESIGVNNNQQKIPEGFVLYQNFPNPFNPSTKIKFSLPNLSKGEVTEVSIKIYDILGKEVTNLIPPLWGGQEGLDTYEVEWNAIKYPSGIYFYRLTAGDYSLEKKMVLLK